MLTNERRETVRFGPYEVDFDEGVLRKFDLPVKLQGKPLAVLSVLIENAGKIVTREQLQRSLWPENTFVDFDKNLSTAVNKLRDALCDSANDAQYIETVPRKGYRFCAQVEFIRFPEPETASPPQVRSLPPVLKQRVWAIVALSAATLAVVFMGVLHYRSRQNAPLSEKDTVVLADFDNSTGDAVFDEALKTALTVSLRQSPFLNVLPAGQVANTLKLMMREPGTQLTADVARELCLRTGSRAYLVGAIGRLGNEYVLQLKAVNCRNGTIIAREQVTATSRDKVVNTLGEAAAKLRGELGESLATVQRFDVPLEQATTRSLEALQAYSFAQKMARENGAAQSLPYAQHAIELDANFAMAYEAVGVHYFNLAEPARAGQYLAKAFQLRDHASERERLKITASYYASVSGELDKAAQAYQLEMTEYPRDIAAYNNLGITFAEQGEYEKAAEITEHGIRIEPSQVTLDENLTGYLLALQRFDDARRIIHEEQRRKPDNYIFPSALYALAFLSSDSKGMMEQENWFAGRPEYENFGLALASDTEAFAGHLSKAQELTTQAVHSAVHADRTETGAIWQAAAAQREAAFGFATDARRLASNAVKLAPTSQGVEVEAALAFASAGDKKSAESLAQDLNRRFPLDTQMQSVWLPAIRAQLELDHGDSSSALKTLKAAVPPLEFGAITFAANASGSCLSPTYLRGQAYLATGQSAAAAAEFQKVIDHSGIVWNCWTGALSRLGIARAYALEAGRGVGGKGASSIHTRRNSSADSDAARVRALAAYKDFLTLWKEADADIPIFKQAKAEYANLQ